MAERKHKFSFVQILIIMALLWIMISILGGGRQKHKVQRTAPRPSASSQVERPSEGRGFFMPHR
jgi:hypothetical protein